MRSSLRLFLFLFTICIGFGRAVAAQDTPPFAAGDHVLVTDRDLAVYVKPDTGATVATDILRGMVSKVVAVNTNQAGVFWIYLDDNAYGWVEVNADQPEITLYTEAAMNQFIAEKTDAISANPDDVTLYTARGMAYLTQKSFDLALADYNHAIELDPQNGRLYDYKGKIELDMHDYQQMEADVQKAIDRGEKEAGTYNRLAIAFAEQERITEATFSYTQAMDAAPGYGLLYSNFANLYANADEYDQALEQYGLALQNDPYLVVAYYNRSLTYRDMGNNDADFKDLSQAIEIDPFYADAYVKRGVYFDEVNGDRQSAMADFQKAVDLDPQNDGAYAALAITQVRSGDAEGAIANLKKAISINPHNDHARFNLATIYGYLGRYSETVASYTEAIQVGNGYDVSALLYRPMAYIALGDYDSALKDLDGYLEGSSRHRDYFATVAYLTRGAVHLYRGEYALAGDDYKEAFRSQPDFAQAYQYYGSGYRVTPLREQTIATLQAQASATASDADLQLQLANIEMEYGYWLDALGNYRAYLNLKPDADLQQFVDFMSGLVN